MSRAEQSIGTSEVEAVGAGERDLHEVRVLEVAIPRQVVHDRRPRRPRPWWRPRRRRRHVGAPRLLLPPLHPRLLRSRPAARHHHRHALLPAAEQTDARPLLARSLAR